MHLDVMVIGFTDFAEIWTLLQPQLFQSLTLL
jgi:hypothetical protein